MMHRINFGNKSKIFVKGTSFTAQKMKFSSKNFLTICDHIRSFLWIWSHLLKKSLMENFIFCQCFYHPAKNSAAKNIGKIRNIFFGARETPCESVVIDKAIYFYAVNS